MRQNLKDKVKAKIDLSALDVKRKKNRNVNVIKLGESNSTEPEEEK